MYWQIFRCTDKKVHARVHPCTWLSRALTDGDRLTYVVPYAGYVTGQCYHTHGALIFNRRLMHPLYGRAQHIVSNVFS